MESAYDYSKSFAQQVDDYDNHLISKSDSLIVGPTPDVLQKVGFNTLPVTINTTHVDYALYGTKDADHYLGKAALKQLPQSIKDPVAVFVSQTQSKTSVVALLNWPLRKFCVSDIRQNQEYHTIHVHDGGLFPLSTAFPGGWDGMRTGTA